MQYSGNEPAERGPGTGYRNGQVGRQTDQFEDRQICFTIGRQIAVYEKGRKVWDAVCSPFHYGGQCGLLEVMGVIVDGKRENGEVKGWQTADDVIQMVKAYKCNKMVEER